MANLIPAEQKRVKEFRSKYGSHTVGCDVTVDQMYGGMRGIKGEYSVVSLCHVKCLLVTTCIPIALNQSHAEVTLYELFRYVLSSYIYLKVINEIRHTNCIKVL